MKILSKTVVSLLLILLVVPISTLAQEVTPPGSSLPPVPETTGTVNCFDYYHFGSVFPAISTPVQSAVTGTAMTFTVDMENSNSYPVVDGTLYVKIFRSQPDEDKTYTQGNHVVDQFKAATDVTIDANTTKSLTFDWQVPLYAGEGEYYAATFFVTSDRYNLSGLTFTDDIIGGSVPFTLSSETGLIYLDKNSVTLNGEDYRFIGPPLQTSQNDNVEVSFPILNDSTLDQEVIVEWRTNEWDTMQTDNILAQAVEVVTVPANSSAVVTYDVPETGAPVYLVEPRLKVNGEVVSAMNVRFVRADTDVPRINFSSVTNYPLKAGEENVLFSCVHNAGYADQVPDGELTLTLYDTDNNQLHQYQYNGVVTGTLVGVADAFTPSVDISDFTLHAVLKVRGEVLEDTLIEYSCEDINPDVCVEDAAVSVTSGDAETDKATNLLLIISVLLVLLAVAAALYFRGVQKAEDDNEEDITRDPNELV